MSLINLKQQATSSTLSKVPSTDSVAKTVAKIVAKTAVTTVAKTVVETPHPTPLHGATLPTGVVDTSRHSAFTQPHIGTPCSNALSHGALSHDALPHSALLNSALPNSTSPNKALTISTTPFTRVPMDTLYPNNSKQYSGSSKSTTTVSKAHETKTPSRSVVSSQSVIAEEKAPAAYNELMERLAEVPTKTKQSRQKLYVDLWSGQHWLGLTLSAPDNHHVMMPVSEDTAVSVSVSPDYISLTLKDT